MVYLRSFSIDHNGSDNMKGEPVLRLLAALVLCGIVSACVGSATTTTDNASAGTIQQGTDFDAIGTSDDRSRHELDSGRQERFL